MSYVGPRVANPGDSSTVETGHSATGTDRSSDLFQLALVMTSMTRPARHRAAALVLGAVTGGVLRWGDAAPGLAAVAGISLLVLVLVAARAVREHPEYTSADRSWRDNRWSAVGQAFVVLVGFQAVSLLPVALPDQVALYVVVIATFMTGYFAGGLDALERDRTDGGESDGRVTASTGD